MKVGIDLGGTKTEAIVLDSDTGLEVFRQRFATKSSTYQDVFFAITQLLSLIKKKFPVENIRSIGLAMPGATTKENLVKNSNTTVLNGRPFVDDLQKLIGINVEASNDANCFVLSEAVDGAGESDHVVFGIILGTGVGGGIVIDKKVWVGANSIAGEWGHNPLPALAPRLSSDDRLCYCGQLNCVETFLCGKGLLQSYQEMTGKGAACVNVEQLLQQLTQDELSRLLSHYAEQLAASLAVVINIIDPDCIVLGGGLSNIENLPLLVEQRLAKYVFSDDVNTRVVKNHFGDSSGVRGAAWLSGNG